MNNASRARTTKAIPGPTRKCRSLPAPIAIRCPPARPRTNTLECATGHGSATGMLLARTRPRLRWHAVPFAAEGARPALGHAHLCRALLARRVQCPVPAQPVEGPDRPVGGLRPADADRLRPRRRARRR